MIEIKTSENNFTVNVGTREILYPFNNLVFEVTNAGVNVFSHANPVIVVGTWVYGTTKINNIPLTLTNATTLLSGLFKQGGSSPTPAPPEYPQNGMVLRYSALSIDEPTPTTWEDLVGTNNATLNNVTFDAALKALVFDGSRATFVGNVTPEYTIHLRVYRGAVQGVHARLFGETPFYNSYITSNTYRYSWYRQPNIDKPFEPATQMPPNRWVSLTYTYTGGTVTLYEDGVLIGTITGVNAPVATAEAFIGANASEIRYFKGMFREFMIYDRAIPESEVAELVAADLHYYSNL